MRGLKRNKNDQSIVTQTAFRVSVVFIIAIIFITAGFMTYITNTMTENILKEKESQTQTIAETIESKMDSMTNPIISLASYNSVIQLLKDNHRKYSPEWMQDIRNIDSYLNNINLFYDYVMDIVVIRADNENVYSMTDVVNADYNFTEQKWFQDALKQDYMIKYQYHSSPDFFYIKNPGEVLSVIYPVYEKDEVSGYILYEYSMSSIQRYFRTQDGQEGSFLLTDQDGNLIYDFADSVADQKKEQLKKLLLTSREIKNSGNIEYGGKIFTYQFLKNNGWGVLSESSRYTIHRPARRWIILMSFMAAGILIVLIWITVYSAKKIKRPYDLLIERIVSFDGRIAEADSVDYRDAPREIYTIAMKFEEMAQKIDKLIQEVYVAELSRKEMELEAMVNQINPHFLYNVFQLIQTEAVLSDNEAIEEMIQKLSEMLRYTMERKRDKVKIREEVDYIKNYLTFYKERFENRFEYKVEYDDEVLEYPTIKFILQPVVENCFKHGFKNKTHGGIIRISIWKEKEFICFSVYDNGTGIPADKLEKLRTELENNSGTGIGIINTNSRLKVVYGASCGITFDSEEGKYTNVTIRIKEEGVTKDVQGIIGR